MLREPDLLRLAAKRDNLLERTMRTGTFGQFSRLVQRPEMSARGAGLDHPELLLDVQYKRVCHSGLNSQAA